MSRTLLVVVAFGLLVAVSGCATGERLGSNLPQITEEQALVNRVSQRLSSDPVTARLSLGIASDDGVVTLTGRIDQSAVRMRAVSVVRGTPGVRGVIDKTLQF
jgi:osmotically-inducible protein OsmY